MKYFELEKCHLSYMKYFQFAPFYFTVDEVFSIRAISFVLHEVLSFLPFYLNLHEVFSNRATSFVLHEVLPILSLQAVFVILSILFHLN